MVSVLRWFVGDPCAREGKSGLSEVLGIGSAASTGWSSSIRIGIGVGYCRNEESLGVCGKCRTLWFLLGRNFEYVTCVSVECGQETLVALDCFGVSNVGAFDALYPSMFVEGTETENSLEWFFTAETVGWME